MEAYKIGVRLAMTSNAPEIMATLSKSLLGINAQVDQLTGKFNRLHAAIGGAMAVFAGEKIISGLVTMIEKTADLSHELAQIQKLGGNANSAAANARAIEITRDVRGIDQRQALSIYGQTYGLLGNEHALAVQELLAKYGVAMGNTLGDPIRGLSGSRDLVRAAEQMGRLTDKATGNVDLDRFQKFVDMAAKIGAATDGQVGASQLYQLTQQGGPAMMNMTDRGVETMAVLSQYMGAHRAGTALMSLNQQMAGGTMWTRNAKEMERLGILGHDEWSKGGGGGIVMTPEARKRLGNGISDPLSFVVNTLLPALDKKGITNIDDQIREVYSIFGRQTSQREIADIIRNRGQIGLELGRLENGKGVDDQLKIANDKDVSQNLENVAAAWKNLWYAVAGPNSEREIAVLKVLTGAIESMTAAASAHPEVVKAIAVGLAALGAFFIGAGAAAIIGAIGAGGWLVGGIVVLGAALALVPWKTVFDGLVSGLSSLGQALASIWNRIKGFFGGNGAVPGVGSNLPATGLMPGVGPTSYTGGGSYDSGVYYGGAGNNPMGINHAPPNIVGGGLGPLSPVGGHLPASVRYNNPGAQWPRAGDARFGAIGYGRLADGNLIERFPDPASGAAANMALFASKYVGMRLGAAGAKWTGGHGFGVPGYDPNMVVTSQMMADPNFVIPFFKAIAGREAGHRSPLTEEQWRHGFDMYRAGGSNGVPPAASGQEIHVHTTHNLDGKTIAKSTMKHIVGQGNRPASGGRTSDIYDSRPMSI